MGKYYNIDENKKVFWWSLAFLLLIPYIGAWFFGTKLTSYYSETRMAGGLLCILVILVHTTSILYFLLK